MLVGKDSGATSDDDMGACAWKSCAGCFDGWVVVFFPLLFHHAAADGGLLTLDVVVQRLAKLPSCTS